MNLRIDKDDTKMNLYLRVLKDNYVFDITKMILYLRDNTDDTAFKVLENLH